MKKVEVKNIGFSGARQIETGMCACCGSKNLKERVSQSKKLLKESIPEIYKDKY